MDGLELIVSIKANLNDYEKSLDKMESDAKEKGSSIGSALSGGLGKAARVAGTAVKAVGTGITVAAAAVGKLASSAVSAYGSYQQLEGGIQTLFGKDAQKMMDSASKAFKTAGVSANQYMEMAIQSSASMISSLEGDTERAADLMDQSIIDMSDNVNKMGTTMEAVQNAYRGFSRGNFTMLDNLALGYAGTKEGMKQLLADAEKIAKKNGQNVKYSIESYADMVEAIHMVQTEMGITGTTSKEAADTITGSAGSAKAAWEDLKVAIASGNDSKLTKSLDNLIASVTTMAENIIPIFERALKGIGSLIEKVAPLIAERLPSLVEEILPGLLSAATSLFVGLVKALPTIVQVLIKEIPVIAKQIGAAIQKTFPIILNMIKEGIPKILNYIKENFPKMLEAGANFIKSFAEGMGKGNDSLIDAVMDALMAIWDAISSNYDKLIDAGMKILEKLIDGIINNLPKIAEATFMMIERLGTTIIEKLPEILEKGKEILLKLVKGITDNLPKIVEAAVTIIKNLAQTLIDNLPEILQAGVDLVIELATGIFQELPNLITRIPEIITELIGSLLSFENIEKLLGAGFDIIGKIFEGIFSLDFVEKAFEIIASLGKAILGAIGGLFEVGAKIIGKVWEGMKNAWEKVTGWMTTSVQSLMDGALTATVNTSNAITSAITPTNTSGTTSNSGGQKYGYQGTSVNVNMYMGDSSVREAQKRAANKSKLQEVTTG